ncbi:MAG: hypothetical protein KBC84_06260 [Proteobacteria bacterium]|nr:hypothetical protein [Pseudomonadota bacterium]
MKKTLLILAAGVSTFTACSSSSPKYDKELYTVEYYKPSFRQAPPEPVYSRVMWSQTSQPIKPKVKENAPLLMPEVDIELPKSNLEEAIQAIAQTIGYTWSYPKEIGSKPVRLKMVATVDEVLAEIDRQTNVTTVLDHESRVLKVVNNSLVPQLTKSRVAKR